MYPWLCTECLPQATPERLITQLLVESVDDSFHKDFLLTYRTFLDSPQPVLEKLKDAWHEAMPDLRDRVSVHTLGGVRVWPGGV